MTVSHAFAARPNRGTDPGRAAILRIEEDTDRDSAAVAVTLVWNGQEARGEASGTPEDTRRPTLVGRATLNAIEGFGGTTFRLIDTTVARAGGFDIAVVAVHDPGILDHPLVGSAAVCEGNLNLAAARATLDAVNRRLGADG